MLFCKRQIDGYEKSIGLNLRRVIMLGVFLVLFRTSAMGTSMVPMTFENLERQAAIVFYGEMVAVENHVVEGNTISSEGLIDYHFRVEEVFRGDLETSQTIVIRQGTPTTILGQAIQHASFDLGERYVLFLGPRRPSRRTSPVLGDGSFREFRSTPDGEGTSFINVNGNSGLFEEGDKKAGLVSGKPAHKDAFFTELRKLKPWPNLEKNRALNPFFLPKPEDHGNGEADHNGPNDRITISVLD